MAENNQPNKNQPDNDPNGAGFPAKTNDGNKCGGGRGNNDPKK